MAFQTTLQLPDGYTRISDAGPTFDVTRVGRPGRWDINQNDPFGVNEFSVSYVRQEYLRDINQNDSEAVLAANERFNEIYAFFLKIGASGAFLVNDPLNNRASAMGGQGTVELFDGVYRLGQRFGSYWHPITRPKAGTVLLGGGAAGGILDNSTGVVAGINSPGTWEGGFWRPMVFLNSKLSYEITPDGIVRAFSVPLQENLEI